MMWRSVFGIISLVTFVQLITLTHVPLQPRELTFPAYINVVNPPIDAEYRVYHLHMHHHVDQELDTLACATLPEMAASQNPTTTSSTSTILTLSRWLLQRPP